MTPLGKFVEIARVKFELFGRHTEKSVSENRVITFDAVTLVDNPDVVGVDVDTSGPVDVLPRYS